MAEPNTSFQSTSIYRGDRTLCSSAPLTTGHFCTTVNPLDQYGHAYSPGAAMGSSKPGPRKVGGKDHSDDPYMPTNVDPIGDTPWILFVLLVIGYGVYKKIRKSRREER